MLRLDRSAGLFEQRNLTCGVRQAAHRRCAARPAAASTQSHADVAVVGGGAAGLTAAYFAARQGAKVTILERMPEAGRKILISGGTRCNVLPMDVELQRDYFTESSQGALRGMLSTWPVEDCKAWLEHDIGLALASEEQTRKWFPASNSSREVRDKLLAACHRSGVAVQYGKQLQGLTPAGGNGSAWRCQFLDSSEFVADRVVMATGGKSYPKLGTDGIGWDILSSLGHQLHEPYPALTPLLAAHPGGTQLAGLTIPGAVLQSKSSGRKSKAVLAQRNSMLFSHRGVTGPSILDLSHHTVMAIERGTALPALTINWTAKDETSWAACLAANGGQMLGTLLHKQGIPTRLAAALCAAADIDGKSCRAAELPKNKRLTMLKLLTTYQLVASGHEGYPKAEVTGGGVPLKDINCASCESRLAEGIHICGELLDVFGRIGGFNFYWAFVSARLAGLASGSSQC